MKSKRFEKKLSLHKETLSNLKPGDMKNLKGADGYTDPDWNTIEKRCYIYSCINCTWPVVC